MLTLNEQRNLLLLYVYDTPTWQSVQTLFLPSYRLGRRTEFFGGQDLTGVVVAWETGRRQGRHSYQPRATPRVHQPKTPLALKARFIVRLSARSPLGVSPKHTFHRTPPGISVRGFDTPPGMSGCDDVAPGGRCSPPTPPTGSSRWKNRHNLPTRKMNRIALLGS
jgi:hypothetical protein